MPSQKPRITIKNGNARQRIMRCVAILFLLYTGVDLANPQICGEENIGVAAASEVSVLNHCPTDSSVSVSPFYGRQRDLPPDKESADEDWFCCCAHIVLV